MKHELQIEKVGTYYRIYEKSTSIYEKHYKINYVRKVKHALRHCFTWNQESSKLSGIVKIETSNKKNTIENMYIG